MKSFLIFFGIAAVLFVLLTRSKQVNEASPNKITKGKTFNDDYEIWLDIFKKEKTNIHEFMLFGTKAAFAWNQGDSEVVVICITSFRNEEPITNKWDHFEFNIKEKYWAGIRPKGSPAQIREELKKIGLI